MARAGVLRALAGGGVLSTNGGDATGTGTGAAGDGSVDRGDRLLAVVGGRARCCGDDDPASPRGDGVVAATAASPCSNAALPSSLGGAASSARGDASPGP